MKNSITSGDSSPPGGNRWSAAGRHSDFSIDFILSEEGPGRRADAPKQTPEAEPAAGCLDGFAWLQCTRYRPPKLQRSRRKEGRQRRQPGRNPRIPFSGDQVALLEERFRVGHYLGGAEVAHLSSMLCLSETRVKIWFQNRRARERRERQAKSQGQGVPNDSSHDNEDPTVKHSMEATLSKPNNKANTLPTSQTSAFIPYALRLASTSIVENYKLKNYHQKVFQEIPLELSLHVQNKHRIMSSCK